jgi:hypothetical protein
VVVLVADKVRVVVDPQAAARISAEVEAKCLPRLLDMILADAKRAVPVDTGDLRASGEVLGISNGVGRVGFGTDPETELYAAVVEGLAPKPNPNYPVQPYLRPALYRKRSL